MYIVVTVAVFEAVKYVLGSSSVLSKFLVTGECPNFMATIKMLSYKNTVLCPEFIPI